MPRKRFRPHCHDFLSVLGQCCVLVLVCCCRRENLISLQSFRIWWNLNMKYTSFVTCSGNGRDLKYHKFYHISHQIAQLFNICLLSDYHILFTDWFSMGASACSQTCFVNSFLNQFFEKRISHRNGNSQQYEIYHRQSMCFLNKPYLNTC